MADRKSKLQALASQIARAEGKKSQVKIGDIREIVGLISDVVYQEWRSEGSDGVDKLIELLLNNGLARRKKIKPGTTSKRRGAAGELP